jgi:putative PIN family toxin of toxin-antitoxin system
MRVIVDSNVLFSALISPHNPPHTIYQAWRQGLFELVTCKEQIDEIRRASRYDKFKQILHPHEVGLMLNNMKNALLFDNLPSGYEAQDPNDSFLLALAIKSKAHYLVTGDKKAGLLMLKTIGQTRIISTSAFYGKIG